MLFSRKSGQAFYSSKISYPAGLDPQPKDVLSAFSIFYPKKVPSLSLLMSYLIWRVFNSNSHWTVWERSTTEFEKAAIVSSDLSAEWKMYRQLLIEQPNEDLSMHIALFPTLHTLATICLSIPISIVSAEQSFSDMKLIKNRLGNRLTELSPSNLMTIVIESPKKLTDSDLEEIVDIWNRKGRRLLYKLSFRFLSHYICILLMHFDKHCQHQ